MILDISVNDDITKDIKKKLDKLNEISKVAHQEYVKLTPEGTGNARKKTKLSKDTIRADYEYATRLDQGYSRQAPQGMTKPWEGIINDKIKKILGRT